MAAFTAFTRFTLSRARYAAMLYMLRASADTPPRRVSTPRVTFTRLCRERTQRRAGVREVRRRRVLR